jgi:hypothetical protein
MNERLRQMVKIPLWMPTRANRRLQQAVAELNQTVEDLSVPIYLGS